MYYKYATITYDPTQNYSRQTDVSFATFNQITEPGKVFLIVPCLPELWSGNSSYDIDENECQTLRLNRLLRMFNSSKIAQRQLLAVEFKFQRSNFFVCRAICNQKPLLDWYTWHPQNINMANIKTRQRKKTVLLLYHQQKTT